MRNMVLGGCIAVIGLALYSPSALAGESTCRQFADRIQSRINDVVHNQDMSFQKKSRALSDLFEQSVDINWIARAVAGPAWKNANEQERTEYVKAYGAFLSGHYIGGLSEDNLDAMLSLSMDSFKQSGDNTYNAHVKVTQKSADPISVNLMLEESPATVCHVRDFTMEGISLLTSQREQIQDLASQGGLAYVTQRLVKATADRNQ
jgi:ABC-type transporter MlaC component